MYIRGMDTNADIFKIETNHVVPSRGKVLISEPFLYDEMFGRSVILLVDHSTDGTMGLVLNKPLPLSLNDVLKEFKDINNIPIYKGGPLSTDTLFYLHTLKDVEDSLQIGRGVYLNGDFDAIRRYILQGNDIDGKIRFFLGYSGWEHDQLCQEIEENTWLIGSTGISSLMDEKGSAELWKNVLGQLGGKYEIWSRFPQIPTLN
jgi:putative transcriptional regulator